MYYSVVSFLRESGCIVSPSLGYEIAGVVFCSIGLGKDWKGYSFFEGAVSFEGVPGLLRNGGGSFQEVPGVCLEWVSLLDESIYRCKMANAGRGSC